MLFYLKMIVTIMTGGNSKLCVIAVVTDCNIMVPIQLLIGERRQNHNIKMKKEMSMDQH